MASEPDLQVNARKQLLAQAAGLSDALKRYLKLLGDDQGKAARLSRSSHRDLFIDPAQKLHAAWLVLAPELRETATELAYDRARFVERTEALRGLTDRVDDWQAWDEAVSALAGDTQTFINALMPPPEDERAEASARMQPLRALFNRYCDLVSVVDVAVLAFRADSLQIISARISCMGQRPAEIRQDRNDWLAVRTTVPSDRFPALLDQIATGHLELAQDSFRFPVSKNINYAGFRTHTKMLGDPAQPRSSATFAGGSISNVVRAETFYRWRERLAVETAGAYYDVEGLVDALQLRQPISNAGDDRQIALEFEIPLRTHLVALTRDKFSLSLLLSSSKPAAFRGNAILKNESTKEVTTIPLEVNDDGYLLDWPTRTPSGTSNRVGVKIADDDGILFEENFETRGPDSPIPFLREQVSEPDIADREVALPRTRIRASQRPSPGAELIGTTVGPWALLKAIGSGGYGTVYQAQHEVTHFCCAVKVIPYEDETVVVERLKRETRASNDVEHPAIVPIIDAGIDKQECVAYLAMRQLTGASLAKKLDSAVSSADTWQILKPVVEALALFHERGVIHRDVHPGNIYLADGGQVHLLDFGLCAIVGRPRVTLPATALGHLHYASPEQTMGWVDEAEASTDVWSLGVVLYELLTGKHPFARPTDIAVASAAAFEAHRPANELGVPVAIAQVIENCLQKRPLDRYPSVVELATAFESALRER